MAEGVYPCLFAPTCARVFRREVLMVKHVESDHGGDDVAPPPPSLQQQQRRRRRGHGSRRAAGSPSPRKRPRAEPGTNGTGNGNGTGTGTGAGGWGDNADGDGDGDRAQPVGDGSTGSERRRGIHALRQAHDDAVLFAAATHALDAAVRRGALDPRTLTVRFVGRVVGRRRTAVGADAALVHWCPEGLYVHTHTHAHTHTHTHTTPAC
jgi:hypothetical protein